jgi:GNAT superfamily N-acetyltransferase
VTARFVIEALAAHHDRTAFTSGVEALDHYFRRQVSQDVRRLATACHVATEADTGRVAGFHTLAAGGVPLAELPDELRKRLPRYPSVPVALLGRLAVDRDYRGAGLGAALLWDAITKCIRSEIGVHALVVEAKDDGAVAFYRHFCFVRFGSLPNRLMLALGRLQISPASGEDGSA